MPTTLENSRLANLEEFKRLPISEETENPKPKLENYRNSVWEGESKPTDYTIEEFLKVERATSKSEELESGQAQIISDKPVRDMWDINWANVRDWVRNWRVIPLNERLLLKAVLTSNLKKNANRYGLKVFNLGGHLLQAIGIDLTNIIGNGTCAVRSNLVNELGYYDDNCANNRALDPKTARRAFSAYMKANNIEKLYEDGYVSFHAVVNSGEDLRWLGRENHVYADKLWRFYQGNVRSFRTLKQQGLVSHYIYSHEISARNLLEKEYNPHTHVMFFIPRETNGISDLEWRGREVVQEFNQLNRDRAMSPATEKTHPEEEGRELRFQTRWGKDVRRSIGYYFRVYSTVGNYLKEIRADNIRELNMATREYARTVDELMSGKNRRTFGGTHMPKNEKG